MVTNDFLDHFLVSFLLEENFSSEHPCFSISKHNLKADSNQRIAKNYRFKFHYQSLAVIIHQLLLVYLVIEPPIMKTVRNVVQPRVLPYFFAGNLILS